MGCGVSVRTSDFGTGKKLKYGIYQLHGDYPAQNRQHLKVDYVLSPDKKDQNHVNQPDVTTDDNNGKTNSDRQKVNYDHILNINLAQGTDKIINDKLLNTSGQTYNTDKIINDDALTDNIGKAHSTDIYGLPNTSGRKYNISRVEADNENEYITDKRHTQAVNDTSRRLNVENATQKHTEHKEFRKTLMTKDENTCGQVENAERTDDELQPDKQCQFDDKQSTMSYLIECVYTDEVIQEILPAIKISPAPNRLKKADIIPNMDIFKKIDEHVARTPSRSTATVRYLAKYLKQPCHNELEMVRAVHRWITKNIRYDVKGYMTDDILPCEPDAVLCNRCSICSGYSRLFQALCRELNVKALILEGYAKGFGYDPEKRIETSDTLDHAWNAVFVNKEWRLIDCTWDAGHTDDKNFYPHESDFYFLTDPEIFINDHFPYMSDNMPCSMKWQLLRTPVDLRVFSDGVKRSENAFKYQVDLLTHRDSVIFVNKEVVVKIKGHLKDVIVEFRGLDGSNYDQYVFLERCNGNIYQITVTPPALTTYKMILYGNQMKGCTTDELVSYIVKCSFVDRNVMPYPEHSGPWGATDDYKQYGFHCKVNDKYSFETSCCELEIILPTIKPTEPLFELHHAVEGQIDSAFVFAENCNNGIRAIVRFQKSGYHKLTVFAQRHDSLLDESDAVIYYLIYSKYSHIDMSTFPEYFPHALQYSMSLSEPLIHDLPTNSKVRFRFISPQLTNVMIDEGDVLSQPQGTPWDITVTTPEDPREFCIFGNASKSHEADLNCLYRFNLVKA